MSKRAGAVSADTREAILQAARDEFYELGFRGASLRQICKRAGVTTGAIYFFFSGKDELFEMVLSTVTEPFMACMQQHYDSEHEFLSRKLEDNQGADIAVSVTLIDLYFKNQKTWDILLHHQSHPAVEKFLDTFLEQSTDHYLFLLELARKAHGDSLPVDRFAVHQFAHMQTDTMLTLISHDFSREEMIRHSATVTKMLRAAFQSLVAE